MRKKINIVTLGCPKNQDDTRNLASFLLRQGHRLVDDPKKAEAIVVHTCSFIEDAKRESLETILKISEIKRKEAKLFVTGCMVQQHGKEMLKEFPEVDAFLGTGQLAKLTDLLANPREKFLDRTKPGGFFDPDGLKIPWDKKLTAYLRISEGCSHLCSFCVIPQLRGPFRSRTEEQILSEAKNLHADGIRELLLIGQDTGAWGKDFYGKKSLPCLLRKIRALNFKWIRLMYMHPYSLSDEIIDVLAESPDVFTYLDLPLQHIDDHILKIMKRKFFERDSKILIEKIRKSLPDISLRTTFLIGYPGETEKQFQKVVDFVREGHFDYVGSFSYSKEDNTPAGKSLNQIPKKSKDQRQRILAEAQFDVAQKKADSRIGLTETVLLEEREGEEILGRTAREAPEIDAVVRFVNGKSRINRFATVKLTAFDAYEFKGTL